MSGLDKEFNNWWDSCTEAENNPFSPETPMFWAWEGWQAAVKAEREACAKVCDDLPVPPYVSNDDAHIWDVTCVDCAAAIRARGQQENG